MQIFLYISDFIVPFMILSIIVYGMLQGVEEYDCFIKGAKKGIRTVVEIMPTLIGLMVAVGILRASGFLDMVAGMIGKVTGRFGFPGGTGSADIGENVFLFRGNRASDRSV